VPIWLLVVAPLLALVLSNADVFLLLRGNSRVAAPELTLALVSTIPLSALASGLTVWFLLRLRREIDRRAETERNLRSALFDRGAALADLERALERERLLRRELDHRVRNNLSSLLGIVGAHEGAGSSQADIIESLRNKIVTLREVYTLIGRTHGEGIELSDLLRAVVAGALGGRDTARVAAAGPSVLLNGREANAFAMIVQELLTNASKHGSLGREDGIVDVSWESTTRDRGEFVALRWSESPARDGGASSGRLCRGMGLSLIEGLANGDLRGGVTFSKENGRWDVELVANLAIPRDTFSSALSNALEIHT